MAVSLQSMGGHPWLPRIHPDHAVSLGVVVTGPRPDIRAQGPPATRSSRPGGYHRAGLGSGRDVFRCRNALARDGVRTTSSNINDEPPVAAHRQDPRLLTRHAGAGPARVLNQKGRHSRVNGVPSQPLPIASGVKKKDLFEVKSFGPTFRRLTQALAAGNCCTFRATVREHQALVGRENSHGGPMARTRLRSFAIEAVQ